MTANQKRCYMLISNNLLKHSSHGMNSFAVLLVPSSFSLTATSRVSSCRCWSSVGQKFWREGGQQLSLGSGCNNSITVMHELLHALGFWHEQSRPDRNQHVEILWENIEAGWCKV